MRQRILTPELMDDPNLEEKKLKEALADVTLVNKWLGGQKITIEGLNYFFDKYPQQKYTIADLGCGDGDMLRKIAKYCQIKNIHVQLTGIDLNPKSISLAKELSKGFSEISFVQMDILNLNSKKIKFDVITITLTMHHFSNKEIMAFLNHFIKISNLGWVVNDLQRSWLAVTLFKAFSSIFMKTYIARHDGTISIKRAFTKKELTTFATRLGLTEYKIGWRWAFRYLWITDTKAQK